MSGNKVERTNAHQQATEQEEREPNTLLHEDAAFKYGFTQMPNQVLYARNLSPSAKTLYAILLSYSWRADRCFPGYIRLCEHLGISSRRIVRKYMHELERVKLLKQKRRGQGMNNVYTLLSLKNALLETTFEADGHMGDHQESHTRDNQNGHAGDHKEYERKNTQYKNISSKSSKGNQNTKSYSHGKRTIGNKETNAPHHDQKPTESTKQRNGSTTNAPHRNRTIEQGEERRSGHREQATSVSTIAQVINVPEEHLQELQRQSDGVDIPAYISSYIKDYSRDLGDDLKYIPPNVSRAVNIFHEWGGGDVTYFASNMREARELAQKARGIRHRNSRHGINRMPYFFTCLRELLGLPSEKTKSET